VLAFPLPVLSYSFWHVVDATMRPWCVYLPHQQCLAVDARRQQQQVEARERLGVSPVERAQDKASLYAAHVDTMLTRQGCSLTHPAVKASLLVHSSV
jgi:hypothetical protein